MHSPRRSRSVARPRQIAMYLAKSITSRSLPEIGRKFGGRDHTTVMHAVKKIEQKFDEKELAKPTSFDTNKFKYAQETLIGEPTIHPPGGIVTSVGLGGLETKTNYGSKPNV